MTGNRRSFLTNGLASLTLASAAGQAAFAQSRPAGSGRAGGKYVLVILRGAMDGLAAIVPHADPAYRSLRGEIAMPEPGAPGGTLPLSDGFGLHPALAGLHGMWAGGEMSFMHAAASGYRDRSHFDGQDVLEQGSTSAGVRDGWLNRALQLAGGPRQAVAIGRTVPLVLRGTASASSWAPSLAPEADADTLTRLMDLYASDPLLGQALSRAVATDAIAGDMMGAGDGNGRGRRGDGGYAPLAQAAAQLMRAGGGPDVCVLSFDGWDTHFRQGTSEGLLANRLRQLDAAMIALKTGLGPLWRQTTVLINTEFGRTARVNGTGGTDHGTGAAAFVLGGNLGGALPGGRMLGDWPGLSRLHDERDLIPANDLADLQARTLAHAWGLDTGALRRTVFV
ncbi:MAG: DUF1501 domain-containing protein [Hyphomonadaceae bacterium]|jgi:uncharacterized protein (DUF1501 family)|nr:DUF1501 domain-containing protein [Hyphomonadaceae bacterium]